MEIIKEIKKGMDRLQKIWQRVKQSSADNQKKIMLLAAGTAAAIGLVTAVGLFTNTRIRSTQLAELVHPDLPTEQVIPLAYKKEAKAIRQKKPVSVMFAKPHGESYAEALRLLDEKADELNRQFYFYPLVYNSDELAQKYKLDPDQVTFIFFDQGEEKNRFVFEELEHPEQAFIPELNRLPMWNIKAN